MPDHFPCPDTMRTTVGAWVYQRQRDDESAAAEGSKWADRADRRLNRPDNPAARPAQAIRRRLESVAGRCAWLRYRTRERLIDGRPFVREPLREAVQRAADWFGRFAEDPAAGRRFLELNPRDHEAGLWPYPFREQRIGLVIRQWVLEAPSPTLARQLAANPRWQHLVDLCRWYHRGWEHRRAKAERNLKAYGPDHLTPRQVAMATDDWIKTQYEFADDASLEPLLRREGFPATPTTARHLRACVIGGEQPYPSRGLVVTTLVPVRLDADARAIVPDQSSPDSAVNWPSDLMTGALLERAACVGRAHRDWLERYRSPPLGGARERGQAYSPAPTWAADELDYLAVARAGWDQYKLAHGIAGRPTHEQVNDFLDDVQHRVYERLKGRRDTTPPKGWRETFRMEVRAAR